MKSIRSVMFMFCFVQATYGAQQELESVFLSRFFSDVTATPGRITLTLHPGGGRIHYYKDSERSRLLEPGETVSLTPGFSEVHFVERHSWISVKRIGSGDLYELTSAFDFRSFGKELEEKKYRLLFSPTELEFKGAVPTAAGKIESSALWSIIAVLIVMVLGLRWLLLRRRP